MTAQYKVHDKIEFHFTHDNTNERGWEGVIVVVNENTYVILFEELVSGKLKLVELPHEAVYSYSK